MLKSNAKFGVAIGEEVTVQVHYYKTNEDTFILYPNEKIYWDGEITDETTEDYFYNIYVYKNDLGGSRYLPLCPGVYEVVRDDIWIDDEQNPTVDAYVLEAGFGFRRVA